MKLSVIRKRSESGSGGPARVYTNGSSTDAPANGTGNDGDVHFSTTTPFIVFQKQDGAWVNVTWSVTRGFSTGYASSTAAQKAFFLDGIHSPSDGDVLGISTNHGEISIHFYAEGGSPDGVSTLSVQIGADLAMNVANNLTGYSHVVTTSHQGGNLLCESLDTGSGAQITWANSGSGVFGVGTVHGTSIPAPVANGPFTIREAVPGSRHLVRTGSVGPTGEDVGSLSYTVFSGVENGSVLGFVTSLTSGYAEAKLVPTALGMLGEPNANVIVRQNGSLSDGSSNTLTVEGFTLRD